MAENHPLDLCSSSEDEGNVKILNSNSSSGKRRGRRDQKRVAFASGTHLPAGVISLVENGNDDNDGESNLDLKVAAKPSPRDRRKRNREQPEIIEILSVSPPAKRQSVPAVARLPARNTTHDVEVVLPVGPPKPKTPFMRVLEVFPDVEQSYVEKLLRDCKHNLEMAISILADRTYPKSKTCDSTPRSSVGPSSSVLVKRTTKVQPKYDYNSPSSFTPTEEYIQGALYQLGYEFSFLRLNGIHLFLHEGKNHYSIARSRLLTLLKQTGPKAAPGEDKEIQYYINLKTVWATKRPSRDQMQAIGMDYCLKRTTARTKPIITDPILKDEVEYATMQLDEWMSTVEEKKKRQEARKRSESSGDGVECGCCFDRVPIEDMVACRNEGHLFCVDCIENYANTAVFSNGSLGVLKATGKPACELLCCDSSGCQSGFHEEHLQKALPIRTLEKYNELQFRANMEAAGISDEICTCPKCGFQADLPPNLTVFQCPVDDCRYESCRKCGKAAHIPLRCEEVVQKKREDEGRLKVEEAMAEAKIRKCHKCKTSFVKSDGCNKMTCRCGAKMCYICRAPLSGNNPYTHFCQVPHCDHTKCGKCKLYSNAEEDDKRAMREAGLTAAQTYREEVKQQEGNVEVNIDVDKIMTNGVRSTASAAIARPGGGRPPAVGVQPPVLVPPVRPGHIVVAPVAGQGRIRRVTFH